jgi:transcription initiation factor TFIIH subunit 1
MKLSEEQFWKRYFQSKLFNAHRASIRSSAAQHVVKDDPIFDKYLEKDDDGEMLLRLQLHLLHTF